MNDGALTPLLVEFSLVNLLDRTAADCATTRPHKVVDLADPREESFDLLQVRGVDHFSLHNSVQACGITDDLLQALDSVIYLGLRRRYDEDFGRAIEESRFRDAEPYAG